MFRSRIRPVSRGGRPNSSRNWPNFEGASASYHYQAGKLLNARGEYETALDNFAKAVEIDENHQASLFELAFANDLRGEEGLPFAEGDTRMRSLTPENLRKFQGRLDGVKAAAAELGVSPAELAIRFCASNPNVSCVIPGVRSVAQAEQNAAAAEPLPPEILQKLLDG